MIGLRLALFAALLATYAGAQTTPLTTLSLTAADTSAAAGAKSSIHLMPANTPAAAAAKSGHSSAAGPASAATPFPGGGSRYPGDLQNNGGEVVQQAQSHAIFVVNPSAGCVTVKCYGNPEAFLQNLAGSDFIHLTDQFTGRFDSNRYTVGSHVGVSFGSVAPKVLTDADMLGIVHLAVTSAFHHTGYGQIYHVFLPPGTDACFDATNTVCYSPDVPNTFYFCAYHGSADFNDIGHVLYTVEPYQNVNGCNVPPGSPNGSLIDSAANVLSHEVFETITDPDGNAWWNTASNPLFGEEIGDECSFIIFFPQAVYFNPSSFRIGGTKYAVQPEYSNQSHSCATSPEN